VSQRLRKSATEDLSQNPLSIYSNIESLSTSRNEFSKNNGSSFHKPPQPLPRTSLGKSPTKGSPEISSVQSKISTLENAILMSSRSNTPINLNLSTQCMPSNTPVIKNRNSDEYFNSDSYNHYAGR
jgi:hypothetical protein